MSVDWTKPIQTRSGLKAELVRRIGDDYWVVITDEVGKECMLCYQADGRYRSLPGNDFDIINVPEEVV